MSATSPVSIPPSRKRFAWMPDFFIVGAMKCGTTSLRSILAHNPEIYIPDSEIFFFDIDDLCQHPDFFPYDKGRWRDFDFDAQLDRNLEWYRQFFSPARPGQKIGEDSASYFASYTAPERIASFNPDARIIIMLRDPAQRAYSQYWHMVRHGRAFFDFEETLRLFPDSVLKTSFYRQHIEHYLAVFPRQQLHFVLLEELISAPDQTLKEVCVFLDVSDTQIGGETKRLRMNRGVYPRFLGLQLWRNRRLWALHSDMFFRHLPDMPQAIGSRWQRAMWRLLHAAHRRINPMVQMEEIPMARETHKLLGNMFRHENSYLRQLTGKDIERHWHTPTA